MKISKLLSVLLIISTNTFAQEAQSSRDVSGVIRNAKANSAITYALPIAPNFDIAAPVKSQISSVPKVINNIKEAGVKIKPNAPLASNSVAAKLVKTIANAAISPAYADGVDQPVTNQNKVQPSKLTPTKTTATSTASTPSTLSATPQSKPATVTPAVSTAAAPSVDKTMPFQADNFTQPTSSLPQSVQDKIQIIDKAYSPNQQSITDSVKESNKQSSKIATPPEKKEAAPTSEPILNKSNADLDVMDLQNPKSLKKAKKEEFTTIVVHSKKSQPTQPTSVTVASPIAEIVADNKQSLDLNAKNISDTKMDITVKPGVTQMVKISKDYLNRLITPFPNPILPTVADIDYTISDNIVYITPKTDKPFSVFITDKSNQKDSISVLFVPDSILPREINFHLEGYDSKADFLTTDALAQIANMNGSTTDSYNQQIVNVMKNLAKGNIPNGYTLNELNKAKAPQCKFTLMDSNPMQMLETTNRRIFIYKVTNRAANTQSILENACYREGVVASAAYPYVNLEPNQSTEFYVLVNKDFQSDNMQQRPVLVK